MIVKSLESNVVMDRVDDIFSLAYLYYVNERDGESVDTHKLHRKLLDIFHKRRNTTKKRDDTLDILAGWYTTSWIVKHDYDTYLDKLMRYEDKLEEYDLRQLELNEQIDKSIYSYCGITGEEIYSS